MAGGPNACHVHVFSCVCVTACPMQARGFMGPTYLTLPPMSPHPAWPLVKRVLALGVHLADVAFFWAAAERMASTNTHVSLNTHTYIHTHTHAHTHAYTHTHIRTCVHIMCLPAV